LIRARYHHDFRVVQKWHDHLAIGFVDWPILFLAFLGAILDAPTGSAPLEDSRALSTVGAALVCIKFVHVSVHFNFSSTLYRNETKDLVVLMPINLSRKITEAFSSRIAGSQRE
jgi:hypothetical protein